jgi:hypothetical protein
MFNRLLSGLIVSRNVADIAFLINIVILFEPFSCFHKYDTVYLSKLKGNNLFGLEVLIFVIVSRSFV